MSSATNRMQPKPAYSAISNAEEEDEVD